ncbi:MAG TPA: SusC/RagA family TonB-linked outer membrane protein [Bacteroidales bacterium]|nr:SusC/RagA family TonB-linked outer membrane protein [Bacteroidales bacterium]
MKEMRIIWIALLLISTLSVSAETLKGKVLSSDKKPVTDAVVSFPGAKNVRTATDGSFTLENVSPEGTITIWADGYYSQNVALMGKLNINVYLIALDKYKYNQTLVLPFRMEEGLSEGFSASNLTKKDFVPGALSIDKSLQGEVAGLLVSNKSGMTGEGAFFSLRGSRSLVADNAPLIVLNGVPYMPNKNESQLIRGYSRSIFQSFNLNDIQNITVLKGADASLYGSLGSNGVILIETDGATFDDMNTKISYYGQFGVNWNPKRIPLLNNQEYKSYLSDIGMTYYDNMETFFGNFPFLTDPNSNYAYLYNNKTDWQNEIYRNSTVNDHLFRVEGGDAIAKYDISLGYQQENGTLKNTGTNRYHTQINSNVLVSKRFEIAATVGLAYLSGNYQEQGMLSATNPVLAAYRKAPLLSPYNSDLDGNKLKTFSNYYFGTSTNMDFATSNPLAMVNTLSAENRQYDVNAKVALTYKPSNDLTFNANVGLYYNYDQESMFIPGISNSEILPLYDQYGIATNTVRVGIAETFNLFYGLNATYRKTLAEIHRFNFMTGAQVMTTNHEFDAGSGRNTPNDFYKTLGDVNTIGRYFFGYIDAWSWMNAYAHADYTYNNLLKSTLNVSFDGASSTGPDAARLGVFPSAGLTFMAKNTSLLSASSMVSKLNFRAEYGLSGNSRFSSNYGKYYYTSRPYQGISGIIRANVPNTNLKWEQDLNLNLGMDASLFHNLLDISAGYYQTKASDVVMISPTSSIYGSGIYYSNDASISSDGLELSFQVAPLHFQGFSWILGGNLATLNNKVTGLGNVNETKITMADGAELITRVGENPYAFYGYKTDGVYSTTAQAAASGLKNSVGIAYQAGDVRYVNQNGDAFINNDDKVLLGSATPDFFGGFYSRFEYKGVALDFNFAYSVGNEAYNAVRRSLESVSDFSNQSRAVIRRWTMEGQVTDVPRAKWGDAIGNNNFSDRWIEDASYLKLRDVTLSYSFKKSFLNLFQSGTIYLTGQNLFTLTDYLGVSPEFSYSYSDALQGVDYAKVAQPKTIKMGVNLKF